MFGFVYGGGWNICLEGYIRFSLASWWMISHDLEARYILGWFMLIFFLSKKNPQGIRTVAIVP